VGIWSEIASFQQLTGPAGSLQLNLTYYRKESYDTSVRVRFVTAKLIASTSFLLCVTSALPGTAQVRQQPTESRSNKVPLLRTTTRLVEVNVVVNDTQNNPMPGLRKKDFTLLVDKKRQAIQVFSTTANDRSSSRAAEPALPDVYRNRVPAIRSGNATVILFDELNTEAADQAFARAALTTFLRQVKPDDLVALYYLGNVLTVLQELGSDPAALYRASLRLPVGSSRELANSVLEDPAIGNPNSATPQGRTTSREAYRRTFAQRTANGSIVDRARLTTAAFIAIANHLGSVAGRKNLIWVSDSFPFSLGYEKFDLNWASDTGENLGGQVANAAEVLNRANIAVYPIDARGLVGPDTQTTQSTIPDETSGMTDALVANLDSMKALAARTGGRAYYSTNNIAGAIRQVVDESRVSYTLGFYPVHQKWDGSFHRLQVKVNVRGASVLARSGFFAIPDAPKRDIAATFEPAPLAELEATGIGMRVDVKRAPTLEPTLTTKVAFDLQDIRIDQHGARWAGSVEIAFLQLDGLGKIINKVERSFSMDFGPPEYEQKPSGEITTTGTVRLLPQAKRVCVVVRDNSSGRFGSLFIPVEKYFPHSS
jgi:VWFA-related protein